MNGLQWGRDHLIAEMLAWLAANCIGLTLQWGRDHLIAEIVSRRLGFSGRKVLQWGRDHLIAEMRVYPPMSVAAVDGFNGAAII